MARLPRLVFPGVPHHVTHRGNRSQTTFFGAADYKTYRTLLGRFCAEFEVTVLAYCLMPNHVHAILVPSTPHGLSHAMGRTAESYARLINARRNWRGHLWQGRYFSCAMGGTHLEAAARYVLLNPVRARLVSRASEWPWSSIEAHLRQRCPHGIVEPSGLDDVLGPWITQQLLQRSEWGLPEVRLHTRTGRPLGDDAFLSGLEAVVGRPLRKQLPGPRSRRSADRVHRFEAAPAVGHAF